MAIIDIKSLHPSGDPKSPSMRTIVRQPGELLALLTVVGVALYGFYRILYDRLYSRVGGINPDEVGLSYIVVISRAAVAVMILILVFLGILGLSHFSGADWRPRGILGPILEGLLVLALATIVLIVFGFVYNRLPTPWGLIIGGGSALLVLFVGQNYVMQLSFSGWFESVAGVIRRILGKASPSFRTVLAIVLLAVAIITAFSIGSIAARDVQGGGHGRLVSSFPGRLLLNIQAPPAEVTWLGGSEPKGISSSPSFIYLGQADGVAVLLETDNKKIYRVASETVVISSPMSK